VTQNAVELFEGVVQMKNIKKIIVSMINRIRHLKMFRDVKWLQLSPTPNKIRSSKGINRYYAKMHRLLKIEDNYILYESYGGVGMIDNPYAMFLKLIHDPVYKNYQHYWVINSLEEQKRLKKQYPNRHIHFVARNSDKYLELLASAKYLINNVSFGLFFSKKEGQIYISTWHSITMKTLGYDSPLGNLTDGNVVRNFLMADYLFAANRFMAKIFRESYKLEGIYEGKIIEEGFPRNDLLIHADKNKIIEKMRAYGVKIQDNKKIILYAPTWKGANLLNPLNETKEYLEFEKRLLENIDNNKYQILIKPHQAVYKKLSKEELKTGKYVPAMLDTNEILSTVDILISDYSSITFDYMHQDKPILFYIPDLESYSEYRGIYFQPEELPGIATDKIEDIIYWIQNIENYDKQYGERFREYKKWVCEYDDGNATDRIIDCIFHNQEAKYRVYNINQTNKKKILMYPGKLAMNGVTSTIKYRLKNIDYSKYDLTLIVTGEVTEFLKKTLLEFDHNIRIMRRLGSIVLTKEESDCWQKYKETEVEGKQINPEIKRIFKRDFVRCFGNAHFDYCIDYSGYGPFWPYLLLQDENAKHIIWQHNVLHLDLGNTLKTQQKSYLTHNRSILATISLYPFMDKIVSVGKCAFQENRMHLSTDETWDKFTYVYNLIAYDTILEKSQKDCQIIYQGKKYYGDSDSILQSENHFNINFVPMPEKTNTNFIAMGRLSAEKNFENLILAFHQAYQSHPEIRLYILGQGDLYDKLLALIDHFHLKNRVFLIGHLMNPFAFIRHCDCLIMPSLYEGLCTSVLEARVLNLPIIMSNFSTAEDISVENGQIMTDMTSNGIYDGIMKFLNQEEIINYTFDPEKFNQKAITQFEELFQ